MNRPTAIAAERKLQFKLLRWLGVGVLLYLLAVSVNYLWYEYSIPRDFRDARWEGEFSSAKHPTSGKVLARLPDPIPRDQEFEFELVVYYDIWSFFLTGKTARAEFIGYLGSEGLPAAGNETRQSVIPRHFSFQLKGGSTPFPDDIRYTATLDRDDQFIAGSYSAQAAFDVGHFHMNKN
jgi:hypothetical protein